MIPVKSSFKVGGKLKIVHAYYFKRSVSVKINIVKAIGFPHFNLHQSRILLRQSLILAFFIVVTHRIPIIYK